MTKIASDGKLGQAAWLRDYKSRIVAVKTLSRNQFLDFRKLKLFSDEASPNSGSDLVLLLVKSFARRFATELRNLEAEPNSLAKSRERSQFHLLRGLSQRIGTYRLTRTLNSMEKGSLIGGTLSRARGLQRLKRDLPQSIKSLRRVALSLTAEQRKIHADG